MSSGEIEFPKEKGGWMMLGGVVLFHFVLGMVPWPWYKSAKLVFGWMPVSYFAGFTLCLTEFVYILIVGMLWLKNSGGREEWKSGP